MKVLLQIYSILTRTFADHASSAAFSTVSRGQVAAFRFVLKEKTFRKEKNIEKRNKLHVGNIWKTQTRLEQGPIVATEKYTE